MTVPTPSPIDRSLMANDLAILAELLAPAIEARLAFLEPIFEIPIVGPRLRSRLQGSPQAMTSDALLRLLDLDDGELVALIDLVGVELGAWRRFNPPAPIAERTAAAAAWNRLLELV